MMSKESPAANEPLLLAKIDTGNFPESNPKLAINTANLNRLLENVGSRPLSVFTILGPQKTGKSLVFGYMVKYLLAAEQENPDWIDWDNPTQPLEDFKWPDEENSPLTPGIWSFNRPFILKSDEGFGDPNQKEVAVLLLYGQQSSNRSVTEEMQRMLSNLMGLAISTSSCTIFNVGKQLHENSLDLIGESIKHAMQKNSGISKQTPFQNALFLVRDWNFPAEYAFGITGGTIFVNSEKLVEKPIHSRESRINRQLIKAMFGKVSGCLLPFPGSQVIKAEFQGSISEMETQFTENLKDFISEVINLDELPLKKNDQGGVMSADVLKSSIERYVTRCNQTSIEEVNSSSVLKRAGVMGVALPGEQKEIMKIALKMYADTWKELRKSRAKFVKESELKENHKRARKIAMEAFRKGINPEIDEDDDDEDRGNWGIDGNIEKFLKNKLDEKYEEVKRENGNKLVGLKEKWILEMVGQYEESMSAAFPEGKKLPISSSEKRVMKESEEFIAELIADFQKKFGAKGDALGESEKERFLEQLKISEVKYLGKILKPERKDFVELSNNSKILDDDQPKRQLESSVTTSLTDLLCRPCDSFLGESTMYESKAELVKMDEVKLGAAVKVDRAKQKIEEAKMKRETVDIIDRLKKSFTDKLMSQYANQSNSEQSSNLEKKLVLEEYQKLVPFPKENENFAKFQQILEDELKAALVDVTLKKKEIEKFRQLKLKEMIKELVARYEGKLEKYLRDNEHMTQPELEKASDRFKGTEIQNLLDKVPAEDFTKIKSDIQTEMDNILDKLSKKCETNEMMAFQQSRNMMGNCKINYVRKMKEVLTNVTSDKTLNKRHNLVKKEVIQKFRENYRSSDIAERTHQLDEILNDAFSTEVKAWFEMKLKGETSSAKLTVCSAQAFYQEQMERIVQNPEESILDEDLLKLHERFLAEALKQSETLEEDQKKQLRTELNGKFQNYRMENNKNLNIDPAIGIDLGTTFCCVSVYQNGEIKILPNSIGKKTTPSYVLFTAEGEEIFGEEAKTRAYENPEGTIFDAKRILGRNFQDEKLQEDMKLWPFSVVDNGRGIPMIEVNGKRLNPEMISAKILEELKKDAEAYLKRKVTRAVITVPAYFTDGQKQATIHAGEMAGLKDISILNEPVAAAMAYKLQYEHGGDDERHILIFDLGGGTFDVAVLKTTMGKIDVLTVDGDTHLGGEDFDRNMMNYCAEEFKKEHNIDLFEGKDSPVKNKRDDVRRRLKRLQGECERQKIALTTGRQADVRVEAIYEEKELKVSVKRATFEKINKTLFDTTIDVVKKALKDAKLEKGQIDDIVLVGGSTRILKIQRMLRDFFDGKELDKKINPDEAVAHGAGLMAAIRKGNIVKGDAAFTKIQDVTPMPIGVEVYGGGFSEIIPKSTPIPVKLEERYRTAHNNQTSVQITIYEGENPIARNNKLLGDFYFNGIPPKEAEKEDIDVEMVISDQGILHVTAKCKSTGMGKSETINVTENKMRMGKETIKRYLAEKDQ